MELEERLDKEGNPTGNYIIPEEYKPYLRHTTPALNAFIARKENGLNLSSRVWNLTDQYKRGLEVALSAGIEKGTSAAKLSRQIREYLDEPDRLFRRVKDSKDRLRLSKAAKAYNPGTGQYRSSYKNAMRLARHEINMAYASADYNRCQQFDFVVGIRIHRSNRGFKCNMCESLKGDYPKDFNFSSKWHTQCMCYTTTILKDREEFWNDIENDTNTKSKNEVTDVPQGFKDWVSDKSEKIAVADKAGRLPWYLRDNKGYMESTLGRKVSYSDVKTKLSKAQKPFENRTYVAFEPFSPVVIENMRKLKDRKQKQSLFTEILNDERTSVMHEIGDVKTTIYPNHRGKKSNRWKETQEMALNLNKHGSNVCFLPEYEEVSSADAIVQFKKEWVISDFKYSSTTKKDTLKRDLEKGFTQANCIVLNIPYMDLGVFRETIDELLRKNKKVGDLIIITKSNKVIELTQKEINNGKWVKKLRGKL